MCAFNLQMRQMAEMMRSNPAMMSGMEAAMSNMSQEQLDNMVRTSRTDGESPFCSVEQEHFLLLSDYCSFLGLGGHAKWCMNRLEACPVQSDSHLRSTNFLALISYSTLPFWPIVPPTWVPSNCLLTARPEL